MENFLFYFTTLFFSFDEEKRESVLNSELNERLFSVLVK